MKIGHSRSTAYEKIKQRSLTSLYINLQVLAACNLLLAQLELQSIRFDMLAAGIAQEGDDHSKSDLAIRATDMLILEFATIVTSSWVCIVKPASEKSKVQTSGGSC